MVSIDFFWLVIRSFKTAKCLYSFTWTSKKIFKNIIFIPIFVHTTIIITDIFYILCMLLVFCIFNSLILKFIVVLLYILEVLYIIFLINIIQFFLQYSYQGYSLVLLPFLRRWFRMVRLTYSTFISFWSWY